MWKYIIWWEWACVHSNVFLAPEVYLVGRPKGLLVSISVSNSELMCWDLRVRPSSFLAGWLACCLTPPGCRLGRVSEHTLGGRTRCSGSGDSLERPPFPFQLCISFQQENSYHKGQSRRGLNTRRHINGWTTSICGKFHWGRVWFLSHFDTQTHDERVQLFLWAVNKTLSI